MLESRGRTNPHLELLELQVAFGDTQGVENTLTRIASYVDRMIALITLNRFDEAERLISLVENADGSFLKHWFYIHIAQIDPVAALGYMERDSNNGHEIYFFPDLYNLLFSFVLEYTLETDPEVGILYFNKLRSVFGDDKYWQILLFAKTLAELGRPEIARQFVKDFPDPEHRSELLITIGRAEASAGDLEAAELTFAEARVEAMSLEPILRAKPLISLGLAYFEAGFVEEAHALALTSADIIRPKFFPVTALRGRSTRHPEIIMDARIALLLTNVGEFERAEETFDSIEAIIDAIPWRPSDRSHARVRLCISRILATRSSCMDNVLQFLETDGRRLWDEDSRVVLEQAVNSMLAHGLYEEALLVADLSNEVEPEISSDLLSTIMNYHLSKGDIATALRITSGQGKIELRDEFSAKLARAMVRANYNNEARSMLVSLSARRSSATPDGEAETEDNVSLGDLLRQARVARIQRTLGFVQDADNTLSAVFQDSENLHDNERRLRLLTALAKAFTPMTNRDFSDRRQYFSSHH